MDKIKFEVCAENINAVKAAIKAGADRVELCRDLALDGLTPDEDTIRRRSRPRLEPSFRGDGACQAEIRGIHI